MYLHIHQLAAAWAPESPPALGKELAATHVMEASLYTPWKISLCNHFRRDGDRRTAVTDELAGRL